MKKTVKHSLKDRMENSIFEVRKKISGNVSRIRPTILISMVLIVITLAIYWQVGNHEFIILDDCDYVTGNPHVTTGINSANIIWAFTSVDASNWHPVTWLSHMADVQMYSLNPRGHHLTNVGIHVVSTLLLFFLLLRLTGALWQSSFVAILFALHPFNVESVAWVAERKNVLSAFFWFLTLILYVNYVRKQKLTLYILTLFSFMLGLMSKPMLVTLPMVMLLLDYWPLDRFRNLEQEHGFCTLSGRTKSIIKEKIPFFICSLFSGVVTIYAQHNGRAMSSLDVHPLMPRIENALIAYVKYIGKTLWPHDLALLYPFPLSIPLWQTIGSLLILLFISAAAIRLRLRNPYLMVGWFWFLVTLLPVIGIIQVGSQSMADRYSYIPVIGLFIMIAWGVPNLVKDLSFRQYLLSLLAAAVIIALAVLTWQQLVYWQDNISLFRHSIQVATRSSTIHFSLGTALASKGDLDAAIHEYQETLRINPKYFEAHNNLGIALASKGDLDAAIHAYQKALRINPNYMEAHNNLGVALASKGDFNAAIHEYQETLRINPNYLEARINLGIALASKGDFNAAIYEYQEVLKINPNHMMAKIKLGLALDLKRKQ